MAALVTTKWERRTAFISKTRRRQKQQVMRRLVTVRTSGVADRHRLNEKPSPKDGKVMVTEKKGSKQ
jgi:hypothetical protein